MHRSLLSIGVVLVATVVIALSLENNPHENFRQAPVPELCYECHSDIFADGYMHPVNVAPEAVAVPIDFPLSAAGLLTCVSCHDIHLPRSTPSGLPTHFLRRLESGKAFCDACHGGAPAPHPRALGEAHFQSRYIVTDPAQEIDAMSKNCISCHDGSNGTSVSLGGGLWLHETGTNDYEGMGNHPIGVDYETARLQHNGMTDLRPLAEVDKRILFFEGQVGCGSCHNPYSYEPEYLVMSNQKSQLCFACHMID